MTAPPMTVSPNGVRTGRAVPAAVADGIFVLVLVALGLIGFRSSYGGAGFLVVGGIGSLLGVAITELARRWDQPVLTEGAVTIVIFLLLGGALVAPHSAIGGVIPTATTFSALGHAAVYGWKELLTTAPPVGDSSHLLAIPYAVGLVGGVAGQSIATRTRSVPAPLLAPAGVLALGILFGADHPTSLLLQGSVFGGLSLGWVALRSHRHRSAGANSRIAAPRLLLAVALVVVSAFAALVIGPSLPGAGSHARVVLSRYVAPPFDANDQPSPLAGFRKYTQGAPSSLYGTDLFDVSGVQAGSHVRITTMDEYDGLVWGFGAGSASTVTGTSGDAFRRFGSTIPAPQTGTAGVVTIHIDSLSGVWMPEIGEATSVTFSGPESGALATYFRYDTATATAVDPFGLQHGDTYRFHVIIPRPPTKAELSAAAPGNEQLAIGKLPPVLQTDAAKWAGSGNGAWAKVIAIAAHLKTVGRYSNGTENPPLALPGESTGRLATFLEGGPLVGHQIVGDDEQYAATLALMANSVGVPARVVLGAVVPRGGIVKGKDVHAWVQVSLAGLGWVPIYQNVFLPTTPAEKTPPSSKPNSSTSAPVEPPISSALRSPLDNALGSSSATSVNHFGHQPGGFHIPGYLIDVLEGVGSPLLALAVVAGAIVGLKARRRRRRRLAASMSSRIAGAWNELVDAARDVGRVVPNGKTRREQAGALGTLQVTDLARRADAAIFGPGDPSTEQVDEYWAAVDGAARDLRAGLSRSGRLRAAVSLRSLRLDPTGASR